MKSITRIRSYWDNAPWAKVVQALAISKLDYSNSLPADLPQCSLLKLRVARHSAAHLISGTSSRTHITPVLTQSHWLPLDLRIQYKIATLAFESLNWGLEPWYLMKHLIHNNRKYTRSTTAGKLVTPRTKVKVGNLEFASWAPDFGTHSQLCFENADLLTLFKSRLKTHPCLVSISAD